MSTNYREPPELLSKAMQADRFRLLKKWQKLAKADSATSIDALKLQSTWEQEAQASADRAASRGDSIPELHFPSELPISAHREEIVGLLKTRQVMVVCGETGSGKSTQLPKFCLDAGLGRTGIIGHTQPRRLAARAVSSRLAEELGTKVGELVGFKIRFTDTTKPTSLVKLMTDGVLLAETQSDRFLDQYDALIIDEAHERSLNIDFLLGYLRKLQARRPDLRLIITSATIDPERFAKHFADEQGDAPIVEVSGRTYPVEVRYRPPEEELDGDSSPFADDLQSRSIASAVDELEEEGSGDVLTFLPTERDIRVTAKYLRGHYASRGQEKSVEILPLYARLSQAEQNKIFSKSGRRRIVLATNVAESSLTVPGIRYVVDTGLVRISRYAPRSRVRRLPVEPVSQASANQRSGRCGRLGPGVCIRLYEEEDFEKRPKFTTPEIKRSDLASVILQSHVLRLGRLEEFPLLEVPTPEALRDGRRTLTELGAIDSEDRLTKIGRQLGALPSDPRVGRMLIEADQRKCLGEVIIIAAALECQDVRQRPAGQRPQADEAHAEFVDPHSDFLSFLRLWYFFENLRGQLGRSRLQKALQRKFLSYQSFREWADVVRQLRELLSQVGMKAGPPRMQLPKIEMEKAPIQEAAAEPDLKKGKRGKGRRDDKLQKGNPQAKPREEKRPDGYTAVHQSLLSGLLSGIAEKGERHEYQAAGGLSISIWPGSGLFHKQPRWIMAAEIVETSKRYGRTMAAIDVEWVESLAKDLLKHSYSDPHWSSKNGSAMVYRRSTLFGLAVVKGRRTPLAPIDQASARSLMIEHGLVAGDWKCTEEFYLHNQEMLADMAELAKRTRSRDYIVDRFHLGNFYQDRLPEDVYDLRSLSAWTKKDRGTEAVRQLRLDPSDLVDESSGDFDIAESFPNDLQVGQTTLPLSYHFEPGSENDGVAVTVPQTALRQVSSEALGWLVPGLLEEKVLQLIRSLPKSLRTAFVPAPDVAHQLVAQLNQESRTQPFSSALCRVMQAHSGESIRPSDFQMEKLPQHLQFLVRVVDDAGTVLEEGRDVEQLQRQHAPQEAAVSIAAQPEDAWEDKAIRPDTFETLPSQVNIQRGGVLVAAYPALLDLGERVEMRLVDTPEERERQTRGGLARLFAMKHNRSLRSQVGHLPNLQSAEVRLSHLVDSKRLKEQLKLLIIRIALIEGKPLIEDLESFEAANLGAVGAISVATQDVAVWLPKLAEEVQQWRLLQERAPATWREVFDDLAMQTAALFEPEFLLLTPWHGLREYPRYVKAMRVRVEKLSNGGVPKDRKLSGPIKELASEYADLLAEGREKEQLDSVRWMLEELRVSIFAQNLGTRQSVSIKRVSEALSRLR